MNKCKHCKQLTLNPQFCSRSCSATYTNKSPKRTREKECAHHECLAKILSSRKYCDIHKPKERDLTGVRYKDLTNISNHQKHSQIRNFARRDYKKSSKPKYCIRCGYDKHYEVCHIKAINTYSKNDFITEINKLSNLIALCRNCHWELDNGLLSISQILN